MYQVIDAIFNALSNITSCFVKFREPIFANYIVKASINCLIRNWGLRSKNIFSKKWTFFKCLHSDIWKFIVIRVSLLRQSVFRKNFPEKKLAYLDRKNLVEYSDSKTLKTTSWKSWNGKDIALPDFLWLGILKYLYSIWKANNSLHLI